MLHFMFMSYDPSLKQGKAQNAQAEENTGYGVLPALLPKEA